MMKKMMFDQPIKRAILNLGHFILFLYNIIVYHIPSNVDYFYYNLHYYYHHHYNQCSEFGGRQKLNRVPENLRIPQHVALAFTNESHQLDLAAISDLICWCKQLGIKNITLFDDLGRIKTRQKELFQQLEHHMGLLGYEKPISYIKGLSILSRQDGRQRFVDDIRDLLKVDPDKIDLELVQRHVGWTSDPELLISFGNHICLYGFPPWQLRLTEIFSLPTHRNITQKIFVDCLNRFSRTTQRLGA